MISGSPVSPLLLLTIATFMECWKKHCEHLTPHIAGGLQSSLDEATWVLTSCLVGNAVLLVFGRKNYYMACVAPFTLSSFLYGVAPNLGLLIVFSSVAGGG